MIIIIVTAVETSNLTFHNLSLAKFFNTAYNYSGKPDKVVPVPS
jgi:hypothetical protein